MSREVKDVSRFITISLLLLVFFFSGVFFGILQKHSTVSEGSQLHGGQEVLVTTEIEEMDEEIIEIIAAEAPPSKQKQHPIEKIASFFEKTVLFLYDHIIYLLYRIADFFFISSAP